jgi:hypothetical protein
MKHPEDEIHRVREFISELSKVQDSYFEELCDKLGLIPSGREWLFDYVFNRSDDYETFEEYLEAYGKSFGEMK